MSDTNGTATVTCYDCHDPPAPGCVRCARCLAARRAAREPRAITSGRVSVSVLRPLTTGQLAKLCCVAPRTVSKWIDSGRLKGYRIPGSQDRRVTVADFIDFLKANGLPVPYHLRAGADVAFGLDGAVAGYTPLDAFSLGGLAATVSFHALLVGDAEGLFAAVALGRAVRDANPTAKIALVLSGDNAAYVPPAGVFDRVAVAPCDLSALAAELTGEVGT